MNRHPGHGKRGRFKFYPGDRVIGSEKKAACWERPGTVITYGPGTGEYLVRFDDGLREYVKTEWLEQLENE